MSRRPKPLAIHRLNGNPRHFSQAELNGDDNPQPKLEPPEMPKGLTKAAKREWRRIVPELQEVGVLSIVDGRALAGYCDAAAMIEACNKDIAKNGLTYQSMYEDKKTGEMMPGDIKPNPSVAIKFTAMKVMKSFLIEFGLTPASRTKLKIKKKDEGDAMSKFLSGRRPASALAFKPPEPVDPNEMKADDADIKPETDVSVPNGQ